MTPSDSTLVPAITFFKVYTACFKFLFVFVFVIKLPYFATIGVENIPDAVQQNDLTTSTTTVSPVFFQLFQLLFNRHARSMVI